MPAPTGSEGLSLVPVMQGTSAGRRPSLFTAYRDVQRAVRDDRWKLIVYPKVGKTQLFDLKADPDEIHNLADDPGHRAELERMTTLLRASQKAVDDPKPLP